MATAHLIHGYLGAGKTTFAAKLASQKNAIRLSADEWYLRLYTDGRPNTHLDDSLLLRLESVLDELWPSILIQGVDVVLDFGFWSRESRDRAVASLGALVLTRSCTG
jgi:predicted kinase